MNTLENELCVDQNNVNIQKIGMDSQKDAINPSPTMFEEDSNSRDSGISMTTCINLKDVNSPDEVDYSKVEPSRIALTDCSNFVAKLQRNPSVSSSRSSSFYNHDTPTGRKKRTVFDMDSLDHSQYEKMCIIEKTIENHRKRASSSMSPSFALMDRKRSRNLSHVAPQSDKACRYNGILHFLNSENPFNDDDGEVFLETNQKTCQNLHTSSSIVTAPAPKIAASMCDLVSSKMFERKTSDTSANGSFHERPKQIMRAMSVGVIDPELPPVLEVKYSLPGVDNPQKESQAFRSISPITLLSEFKRLGDCFTEKYIVVDCRFPFEYQGGHVKGAINLFRHDKIKPTFFPEDKDKLFPTRIPIFYCEYSQKRGPEMAHAVRSIDRVRNELQYPHVEYPEMYLLDYGYKSLWNCLECRQLCEPCAYIPMTHSLYSSEFRSARLERHHSMASLKPNGETGNGEEKTKRCARSAIRKNNSTLSVLSRSSCALNATGSRSSSSENLYLELENERRGPKWVSAFDIQSGSEIDPNDAVIHYPTTCLADLDSSIVAEEKIVQLGLKVITPDFGNPSNDQMRTPCGKYSPLGQDDKHHNTPCAILDFSSLSDTE